MKGSIQSRLLISASLILFFFLGLAGFVIDAAYKTGAESALRERLQIHLYSLLASVELTKNLKVIIPNNLAEPRFSQIDSALFAYVFSDDGDLVLRSKSSIGYRLTPFMKLSTGERKFVISTDLTDASYLQLHYKAVLENNFKKSATFEFVIVESTKNLDVQIADFRSVLWKWLGGIGVLLIMTQFFVLRRSLSPLRHIVVDLEGVQQGERQYLESHYSDELKDIANTLNRLIENERTHLERYRNTLSDLAHSLKTPLTVLTGIYEKNELNLSDLKTIEKQTLMMRQLVDYQLNRAAAKGHQTLTEPLSLRHLITQLTDSLDKVYFDKKLKLNKNIENLNFYAEKGDMYELFGNLLDNAYKWGLSKVLVSVHQAVDEVSETSGISIIIEDNGPGIPDEDIENVLKRGIRADETTDGHGIGLAVVNELVALYKGTIVSKRGDEGGQKWEIFLPGRVTKLQD